MARYFVKCTKEFLNKKIFDTAKSNNCLDLDDNTLVWKDNYQASGRDAGDPDLGNLYKIDDCNWNCLSSVIEKDLSKIEFDMENVFLGKEYVFDMNVGRHTTTLLNIPINDLIGFQTLPNGFTFFGIVAGGDWEYPVFFLLYYDGSKIRGYIPKDGNSWNKKFKSAYGNNPGDDEREMDQSSSAPTNHIGGFSPQKVDLIYKDVQKRIIEKP